MRCEHVVTVAAARHDSAFVAACRAEGVLDNLRVGLIDVGASGGISGFWDQFGGAIRAVGFDPLVAEIARLNAAAADVPGEVRYEAAWVGDDGGGDQTSVSVALATLFRRTSAVRALEAGERAYVREVFNRGENIVYAKRSLTIDGWLDETGFAPVDVLKCDVDGFDLDVLQGARRLLTGPGRPLVVLTEALFHDLPDRPGTAFGDIDRFLRSCGYALFDMDVYRYSRRELPAPFQTKLFASTLSGQAMFCDTLYMLDPVYGAQARAVVDARDDGAGHAGSYAKLVLLGEALGQPDAAAAVLSMLRADGRGAPPLDAGMALDRLVPSDGHANPWGVRGHAAYLAAFDAAPEALFPAHPPEPEPPAPAPAEPPSQPSSALAPVRDWTADMLPGTGVLRDAAGLRSPLGVSGHHVYGPYAPLPEGSYVAAVLLAVGPGAGADGPGTYSLEVVVDEVTIAERAVAVPGPCAATAAAADPAPTDLLPADLLFHVSAAEAGRPVQLRGFAGSVLDVALHQALVIAVRPAHGF